MRGSARDQEPGDQRSARWRTVVDRRPRAFGAAALRVSLVVGTTLTIVNHPQILSGLLPPGATVQIALNFLVPFLVAGFARQALLRELAAEAAPPDAARDPRPVP